MFHTQRQGLGWRKLYGPGPVEFHPVAFIDRDAVDWIVILPPVVRIANRESLLESAAEGRLVCEGACEQLLGVADTLGRLRLRA